MNVVERDEGDPLVLLHGFEVDHRSLLPLDATLAAAGGWRRVYVDLPGFGASPADGVASAEDVVRAVDAELTARLGDAPFAVLGYSFGGLVARRLAHDHRDRVLGLALLGAVFVAGHDRRDVPARTVLHEDPTVVATIGEFADDYVELAVVQDAAGAAAFRDHVRPGLRAFDRDAAARIAARYALERDPEDAWPEPFAAPTLVVTARQDQVVGYRDAWARLEHYPRATFAVVDAAGHNLLIDRSPVLEALVADWLNRVRQQQRWSAPPP